MTIRENLITLREVIASAPAEEINLNYECHKTDCGTTFCVLGWAAASSIFPGLHWLPGYARIEFDDSHVDYHRDSDTLDVLFGERSHGRLFQWPGGGYFDADLGFPTQENPNAVSQQKQKDLALALARIDAQLEHYPPEV